MQSLIHADRPISYRMHKIFSSPNPLLYCPWPSHNLKRPCACNTLAPALGNAVGGFRARGCRGGGHLSGLLLAGCCRRLGGGWGGRVCRLQVPPPARLPLLVRPPPAPGEQQSRHQRVLLRLPRPLDLILTQEDKHHSVEREVLNEQRL